MLLIKCPACAAEISGKATVCTNCGKPVDPPSGQGQPLIHRLSGKLQAVGIVVLAGGIIASVLGAWWGPALLFPGVVIFALGKFW
jgi:hypothetical protein